jgi:hypothetical protein
VSAGKHQREAAVGDRVPLLCESCELVPDPLQLRLPTLVGMPLTDGVGLATARCGQ